MIQMRWATQYVTINSDITPVKVLQYRQMIDPTVPTDSLAPYANNLNQMIWSDWSTVPVSDVILT